MRASARDQLPVRPTVPLNIALILRLQMRDKGLQEFTIIPVQIASRIRMN
jgi:hypothetical protein